MMPQRLTCKPVLPLRDRLWLSWGRLGKPVEHKTFESVLTCLRGASPSGGAQRAVVVHSLDQGRKPASSSYFGPQSIRQLAAVSCGVVPSLKVEGIVVPPTSYGTRQGASALERSNEPGSASGILQLLVSQCADPLYHALSAALLVCEDGLQVYQAASLSKASAVNLTQMQNVRHERSLSFLSSFP